MDGDAHRPRVRLELAAAGARPKSMRRTMRGEKFVDDFVAAWTKVMNADRFDLARP